MSNFEPLRLSLLCELRVLCDLCVNSLCFSLPPRESAKMKYHV